MKTPDATPTAATLRFAPPYSQRSSSLLSFSGPWKSKQSVIFKNAAQSRRGEMSKKKKKNKKNGTNATVNSARVRKVQDVLISLHSHTHAKTHGGRSLLLLLPLPCSYGKWNATLKNRWARLWLEAEFKERKWECGEMCHFKRLALDEGRVLVGESVNGEGLFSEQCYIIKCLERERERERTQKKNS